MRARSCWIEDHRCAIPDDVVGDLHVRLLGGLEIARIDARSLGSRKARTLLARLAVADGAVVDVGAVIDAVWPAGPPPHPANQLAVLVSRLRRTVGASRIERRDAGYVLHVDWLDVAELESSTAEAARRLSAQQFAAARAASALALSLPRGPLLPEEPDAQWAQAARAACDRLVARARQIAAEAALAAGDAQAAMEAATAVLASDPYDEQMVRLLLCACGETGRAPTGLRAYEEFRQRLDDELGVFPEPATEQLYLALLRRPHVAPDPAIVAEPPPAPPGREAQLDTLMRTLRQSQSGPRPMLVEVSGEAGIGKTALLDAFAQHVRRAGLFLATGRCDELGRDLPLQPALNALGAAVAVRPDPEVQVGLAEDAAVVAAMIGIGRGADPGPPDSQSTQRVFGALGSVLRRLASPSGGALVIEDIHLADTATLAWLSYLHAQPGIPLLVVVSRRIEETVALRPDAVVSVGPLDRDTTAAIVGEDRADELWERSRGYPLYLNELASAAPGALPNSIVSAVTDRAARAGDAAGTLAAAAVLGPEVDVELLARVADRPFPEVLDHLEEGVRRRLLVESGASFAFPHALVREALASSTSSSRRAWLHRTAAAVLASRPDADPAVLAHHAREGGDPMLTAQALMAAAAVASRRWQHQSALELLEEAATLHDSSAGLRQRALVLLQLSRYADAARCAAAAVAAEPSAHSYEVLAKATYYHDKDYPRAATLADEAARRTDDPMQRVRCLAFAGRALHSGGTLALARQRLEHAIGDPSSAAIPDVRMNLGFVRLHQGHAVDALALMDNPEDASGELAFAPVLGLMTRGLTFALLGRPLDALAELERCTQAAEKRQIVRYGGRAENCRAYVLRNLGALEEAAEWNRLGAERGAAVAQLEPQAHALLDLADGALESGDHEAAAALLRDAEALEADPYSFRWRVTMRRRLLVARLALATGQAGTAADLAGSLLDEANDREVDRYTVLSRLLLACARRRLGSEVARAEVAADLRALRTLAGMDAWRVTADVAACFDVAAWRGLAAARVQQLAARSGDRGQRVLDYAARRTSSTTMSTRNA